jgi:hypothetical protein
MIIIMFSDEDAGYAKIRNDCRPWKGLWPKRFRCAHMFGGDRHGTHGRRVWDGADARDFAGWLIALMVWLLPGAEWARVSIVIILTYLIGISGFNHIIAGSTTMFFLVVTKSISLGRICPSFSFRRCSAM